MIKLGLEAYCKDCIEFTPILENRERIYFNDREACNNVVICQYKKRCAAIERYLRKELSKGNGNAPGENSEDDGK